MQSIASFALGQTWANPLPATEPGAQINNRSDIVTLPTEERDKAAAPSRARMFRTQFFFRIKLVAPTLIGVLGERFADRLIVAFRNRGVLHLHCVARKRSSASPLSTPEYPTLRRLTLVSCASKGRSYCASGHVGNCRSVAPIAHLNEQVFYRWKIVI